jgi:hypothetical protein
VEAARRLGVHETAVRTVEDRDNESVATLRDGTRMLVSDTVARPYVPEIDDIAEDADEPDSELDEPTKAKAPVKRTQGKAK